VIAEPGLCLVPDIIKLGRCGSKQASTKLIWPLGFPNWATLGVLKGMTGSADYETHYAFSRNFGLSPVLGPFVFGSQIGGPSWVKICCLSESRNGILTCRSERCR
jgi:hypothetical protein